MYTETTGYPPEVVTLSNLDYENIKTFDNKGRDFNLLRGIPVSAGKSTCLM